MVHVYVHCLPKEYQEWAQSASRCLACEYLIRTSQVASILRYCSAKQLAVVPQGGNTGLVGGGVPVFDEIVVSLRRMGRTLSFDQVGGKVMCIHGTVIFRRY